MAKSKFGITTETRSKSRVPIKAGITAPNFLISVKAEEREIKSGNEKGTNKWVIIFHFVDHDAEREYEHIEWEIADDAEKFDDKMEGINTRVKHIYEVFAPFPKDGIGNKAKSWKEFFQQIAEAFNTGKDGKPIFEGVPVWLKLTYYKNNLGFPLFPNFIEKVREGKEPLLVIDPNYDKIEPQGKGSGIPSDAPGSEPPAGFGGNAPGGFPKFPNVG